MQILTGKGPLGQLQQELSLPSYAVDLLVLGIIGYSVVGGLNPKSPTFSEENQRDVRKRGKGKLQCLISHIPMHDLWSVMQAPAIIEWAPFYNLSGAWCHRPHAEAADQRSQQPQEVLRHH